MIIELMTISIISTTIWKRRRKKMLPPLVVPVEQTVKVVTPASLPVVKNNEPASKEVQIDKSLKILGGSLGLVSVGSLFAIPLLSVIGIGLYLYTISPIIIADLRKALIKEKRVSMALLEFTLISLMLITGHFFAATLGGFLYLFSKKLVLKTEDHSRQNLSNLFGQQQKTAWLKINDNEIETPIEKLQAGDIVVVSAGDSIPVDGIITTGIAAIDQHILTGEARPVDKETGEQVFAATIILTGRIEIAVEKAGEETVSAQIGKILLNTADFKMSMHSRGEQIADRTAMPTLIVGGVAFLAGFSSIRVASLINANFGYNMRVLAPISMLNHLSVASKQGILIKDGRALELLQKVDTVVFDKTGTLTEDCPTLGQIHSCSQYSKDELLSYAATAEQKQKHPIALAILKTAKAQAIELLIVEEASYSIGYGLSVRIQDKKIQLGSRRFMELEGITFPETIQSVYEECEQNGISSIIIAVNGKVAGIFEMHITVRPEAYELIHQLHKRGIKSISIISGDNEAPTRKLADKLGIDNYFANVLPKEKANIIKNLQKNGNYVCYIGDGINDSIALKQAHVSISLSGASTIATDTASIILMDGDLTKLSLAFDLAQHFSSNLKRSLYSTLLPGVISVSGVLFLHFGIVATILLNQVGLATGMVNTLLPLNKQKK